MSTNYEKTLNDHGFTSGQDHLLETLTAYDYEVNDALFGDDSPFIANKSTVEQQPNNLNSLLLCTLLVKDSCTLNDAAQYIATQWIQWLRQSSPVYENIERITTNQEIRIRILTISEFTGCSIEFLIKKG